MTSPESEHPGLNVIRESVGQKIDGFVVDQATIKFGGAVYTRGPNAEGNNLYGRVTQPDFPVERELIIVDAQGKIVNHIVVRDSVGEAR